MLYFFREKTRSIKIMSEITSISFCESAEDFLEADKNILNLLEHWKDKKSISKQYGRVWGK